MFAKLINLLPVIPLVGAETKFQPVYVGDVAEAVHYIIQNNIKTKLLKSQEIKYLHLKN